MVIVVMVFIHALSLQQLSADGETNVGEVAVNIMFYWRIYQ